ncbi:DUF192 domain-containing protein [Synechococcus sp. ROS8604]|uniref:DUF192 domain-containing protein n=1 Tax=Synechococcus sp. ROS8604 TaxID=1442557 RepID=UPI001646610E|nr:DUF192 domain-containing protein [Synechococcus sp. ROS8604]QNI87706.1 putative conserved secreted protein [Synechococcus sp. ROS8604]
MDVSPPQQLPLEAQWCVRPDTCVLLEVADQPNEQRLGLMQRPALPPLRGMWFPFKPARPLRFWMLNTLAPLDMVFVHQDEVIAIEAEVPTCPALPCKSFGPMADADSVIELGAGEAKRLGLAIGDAVVIETIQPAMSANEAEMVRPRD